MPAIDRETQRDLNRINRLLTNVSTVLKKDISGIIKQAAVFTIESTAKATGPGDKRPSKMPKKFRFRKFEKIPESFGYFYKREDGNIFRTNTRIMPARARREGLKRITKGIKAWSKKNKAFTYIPFDGTKGQAESSRKGKIPYAGAAKSGWLNSLKNLDSKKKVDPKDIQRSNKKYSRVRTTSTSIEITNLVSYAGKLWPQAPKVGLAKATNRLEKTYLPRIGRRIERDWERGVSSFIKGVKALS